MPTMPAPVNSQKLPEKTETPPAPPTPISSSIAPKTRESTITAVLFIVALLLLCGLIGLFISKSTQTFKLETPVLTALPETTNKNVLIIEGNGPKNATIEISSDSTSYTTPSDNEGKFSLNVQTGADGKVTYFAIARKSVLFLKFMSDRSNEVSTVIDKTAPNLKLVSIPNIVTASGFTLRGTSSEIAKIIIKVNSSEYSIDTDTKNGFTFPIKLQKGLNTVVVTARDQAGNETSTAPIKTTYATGTVYVSGRKGTKQLPNSAGDLTSALTTSFGTTIAFVALIVGALGFMASSGAITLYKIAKGV